MFNLSIDKFIGADLNVEISIKTHIKWVRVLQEKCALIENFLTISDNSYTSI